MYPCVSLPNKALTGSPSWSDPATHSFQCQRARQVRAGSAELHGQAVLKRSQLQEQREQLERSRPFLENGHEKFQKELALLRARSDFLQGNAQMHRNELDQLREAEFRGIVKLEEM